jgi:tungstate transport system permease protein
MDYIFSGFVEAFKLIFSGDPEVYGIIGLSLLVSVTSVCIASAVSIPLGIYLGLKNFKGKKLVERVLSTLMGMPPVVLGLLVYLFLSRRGPLGPLRLYFSVTGMIIAQTLLITPIIMGNILNSSKTHGVIIRQSCKTLGADRMQTLWVLIKELRVYILIAIITGFGRAISEVGAVMLVGGNIKDSTRVMTTFIAMNTGMGNYSKSIAMGVVLLTIAFVATGLIHRFVGDTDD